MAEASLVKRQDVIPLRRGFGNPRAVAPRTEVLPIDVRGSSDPSTGSARHEVAPKLGKGIFETLRVSIARHSSRLARRLCERCSRLSGRRAVYGDKAPRRRVGRPYASDGRTFAACARRATSCGSVNKRYAHGVGRFGAFRRPRRRTRRARVQDPLSRRAAASLYRSPSGSGSPPWPPVTRRILWRLNSNSSRSFTSIRCASHSTHWPVS